MSRRVATQDYKKVYHKPTKRIHHNKDGSKTITTYQKDIRGRTHVTTTHKKATNWKLWGYILLGLLILGWIAQLLGF